ncbi:hypothetical protein HYPSUDRAFT_38145 [Hypholoma sublateritium FD-334 SS-4]|uniref:Uncharacterized protein n=1 Tax=Hypholoma sublateritium (strain FD-334 SS-4) TaxID=945553 RepID=A0A0D2Q0Z0_HYPSF|nr:hypothetical protein HYPSUDRAFT_38145 [Hypholoma sublateritium FD-334 SS-4]
MCVALPRRVYAHRADPALIPIAQGALNSCCVYHDTEITPSQCAPRSLTSSLNSFMPGSAVCVRLHEGAPPSSCRKVTKTLPCTRGVCIEVR